MTYKRKEVIGQCELYLGDCLNIMPTLGKVDAVVTDPPYGIDLNAKAYKTKKGVEHGRFENIKNDAELNEHLISAIFLHPSDYKVVFGSNNFPHLLPHRGRTIVWDKRVHESADGVLGSPFEIAWEDKKTGYDRIIRVLHCGVINADSESGKNNDPRYHPTQKPVKLIRRILELSPYKKAQTILDPFMGSGTTGVACAKLGRKFIGIELEERYFNIACERIREAYRQPDLFIEQPKKAVQEVLI